MTYKAQNDIIILSKGNRRKPERGTNGKMKIEYSKRAVKFINKQDRPTKQRIKKAIEGLTETPPKGDIKPLQGYTDGRKRLRVGKYRIIYNFLGSNEIEILYIFDIDSRGDIYK